MKKINLKSFRNVIANFTICAVLLAIFSITYAGGVLNVFSKTDTSPLYNGNLNNKNVTMMINVYWGTEYLDEMLQILKENNIKTTFFIGGVWASKNTDMLLKIFKDGHEIGNHGYYHKDHKVISYERNREEIMVTHELVKKMCGIEMNLFAPPSGSFSQNTLDCCDNLGYKTIMWTKDTIDWRDKDSDLILSRAIKNAKGGDLILMHPTEKTVEALRDIIKFYVENGFKLTTVSENISV